MEWVAPEHITTTETLKIPTPTEEPGQCVSAHGTPSRPPQFAQIVRIWKPHLQPKAACFSRSSLPRRVSMGRPAHGSDRPQALQLAPRSPSHPADLTPTFSHTLPLHVYAFSNMHESQQFPERFPEPGAMVQCPGGGLRLCNGSNLPLASVGPGAS